MLIVAALGGNAVSLPGKEGNIADQFAATRAVCIPLADLIQQGHQLVITHGNGPQVGNVMRRVEIAAASTTDRVYPLPLDIVVADTEAGMGYMISQCLMNEMASRGDTRICSTIVTTVRVDPDDPAFKSPDKPIGPFLKKDAAERRARDDGWIVREDSGRGWRRVVASPLPRDIIELPLIRTLIAADHTIIAAGGGGIPVMRDNVGYRGVEAVIDKDRTSALLASAVGADRLMILTNVDRVMRDFGKPTAREIESMTTTEARKLIAEKQFPPGSMLPKIEAAIEFVENSTRQDTEVLITSCERMADALAGKTGTRVVRA
jgi:carbamate kinase